MIGLVIFMNQSIRKVMILFFMMIGVLSFNPDKVSAESCEYGVTCTYDFCIDGALAWSQAKEKNCSSLIVFKGHTFGLTAVYKCMDGDSKKASECKSFKSWATCAENGEEGDCASNAFVYTMRNYNEIFNNADKFKKNFIESDQYKCPSLWIKSITTAKYEVYYEQNGDKSRTKISGTLKCIDRGESDEDTNSSAKDSTVDASKDEFTDGDKAKIQNYYNNNSNSRNYSDDVDSCSLISGDVQTLLHDVFLYICIAGIIILIVMTIINLIKVITGADENLLKNFAKSLKTRIICLIILLILPTIVTFAIQVINGTASAFGFNADNPLCGITKKN